MRDLSFEGFIFGSLGILGCLMMLGFTIFGGVFLWCFLFSNSPWTSPFTPCLRSHLAGKVSVCDVVSSHTFIRKGDQLYYLTPTENEF